MDYDITESDLREARKEYDRIRLQREVEELRTRVMELEFQVFGRKKGEDS